MKTSKREHQRKSWQRWREPKKYNIPISVFQLHDEDDHGKGEEYNKIKDSNNKDNKDNKDKNYTCFNLIMMETIMAKM